MIKQYNGHLAERPEPRNSISAALAAFGGRGSEGPLELGCCVERLGPRTSMERDAKYMTQ
jgi:hypothetical protein